MTALIIIVAILLAGAAVTLASTWLIEWRHPPHGRFIEVHGLRRHVVELGNNSDASDNLPIVLLHGAGANLKDMEIAVGERLAARHRVILIDRPGFGFSARKKGGENTPTEQAVILDELFSRLGVDRAIIVGHSWGGTLALTFALDFPARVAGLVLIAPPTHPALWGMAKLNAVLASPIGWLFAHTLSVAFRRDLYLAGLATAFLPQLIPSRLHQSDRGDAGAAAGRRSWPIGPTLAFLTGFWRNNSGVMALRGCPVVAFNGDRDPLVPPEKPRHATSRS